MSEDFKMSFRAIRRRPVESFLLVIGIALGIGATAAGISMISGSIEEQNAILDSTQYKEIVVQVREEAEDMELPALPSVEGEDVILSWSDLDAKYDVSEIEYAYLAESAVFRLNMSGFGMEHGMEPDAESPDAAANGGNTAEATRFEMPEIPEIEGPEPAFDEIAGLRASPEYFAAWNLAANKGSLFTQQEMEDGDPVMVLGSALGETLFEDGVVLGRELVVFQTIYTIVGVLETTGTGIDETAIVPAQAVDVASLSGMGRMMQGGGSALYFTAYDSNRLEEAKAQLTVWFEQVYGEGQVIVSVPREEVEVAQDRTSRLVSVILFLAVAGLLIASVNVSNILLGRAMRRRRNVGILKALGASVRSVFSLFFLEAFIIGAAGAIAGTGISMLISALMASSGQDVAIISGLLFVGIFGAWSVTTILTLFPALQASRIPAAQALRYE
jgi:putative ABC transport system permease protein